MLLLISEASADYGVGGGGAPGVVTTAIRAAVVISTPEPTRMAARCVLIPRINHYNMQYNSGGLSAFSQADALYSRSHGDVSLHPPGGGGDRVAPVFARNFN